MRDRFRIEQIDHDRFATDFLERSALRFVTNRRAHMVSRAAQSRRGGSPHISRCTKNHVHV
jgi:hypothetical protein